MASIIWYELLDIEKEAASEKKLNQNLSRSILKITKNYKITRLSLQPLENHQKPLKIFQEITSIGSNTGITFENH